MVEHFGWRSSGVGPIRGWASGPCLCLLVSRMYLTSKSCTICCISHPILSLLAHPLRAKASGWVSLNLVIDIQMQLEIGTVQSSVKPHLLGHSCLTGRSFHLLFAAFRLVSCQTEYSKVRKHQHKAVVDERSLGVTRIVPFHVFLRSMRLFGANKCCSRKISVYRLIIDTKDDGDFD